MTYRARNGGVVMCHVEGCREPGPYEIVDDWPYCRKHVDRARRAAEPDNVGRCAQHTCERSPVGEVVGVPFCVAHIEAAREAAGIDSARRQRPASSVGPGFGRLALAYYDADRRRHIGGAS